MIIDFFGSAISWLLIALLFFLPAYLANLSPVLLWQTGCWKSMRKPIDGGRLLGKTRVFGENKTWFGLLAAILGGGVGGFLQLITLMLWVDMGREYMVLDSGSSIIFAFFFGGFLGLGAILGDLAKSFLKRRLNIAPGAPWFFFDQVDFVVGSYLFYLVWKWILGGSITDSGIILLVGLLITPLLHLSANVLAFKLGIKKVWW